MKFKEVNFITFPAEECYIPLKINKAFFRGDKERLVMIRDVEQNSLIFRNLYPCLGEVDGNDIFGFVGDSGLEFYSLTNERFIVEGITEPVEISSIVENFKEEN